MVGTTKVKDNDFTMQVSLLRQYMALSASGSKLSSSKAMDMGSAYLYFVLGATFTHASVEVQLEFLESTMTCKVC